ncbi:MAG TPA: hypothetical protein VMU93_04560 [Caulobacteraceae bacterium]|nr:hypothetical protein [Caulobacteraceae bacterium]
MEGFLRSALSAEAIAAIANGPPGSTGSIIAWSDASGDAGAQHGYDPFGLLDPASGWSGARYYKICACAGIARG